MKILLVYPEYPDTFWSFNHALKFIRKKAAFPPLGLLTIASMLPGNWEKKLIDMNVTAISDERLKWADYIFVSAMVVQKISAVELIKRAKKLGKKVVAGGPLFTTEPESFPEVDHLVLNEAEITLPLFLADLDKGSAQRLYSTTEHPDINQTPVPLWSLLNMKKYSSMNVQYSRGCPFNCEFCDITVLDGHTPRTKGKDQLISEFDALYDQGWRGSLFIVDDNFIGNKKKLKMEILPVLIQWMERKHHPFTLFTEASINLSDDEELMQLMVRAGFNSVFVGIETPNEASLSECEKTQNTKRDLVASVRKLQHFGLEVMGGFIVGFDNDPATIFKSQINFIQKTGIVTAMVGILNAPRGTRLYQRLKKENRLLNDFRGDNTDFSLNFIPKMNTGALVDGYKNIMDTIYSPKNYYERIRTFLKEYKPHEAENAIFRFKTQNVAGLFNCMWFLGIREKGRRYYWKLLAITLFRRPKVLTLFMTQAAYGYHFRKVIGKYGPASAREVI